MNLLRHISGVLPAALAVGFIAGPSMAHANDGTWLGQEGDWSDNALWQDGQVPDGVGASATFDVPSSNDRFIRVDGSHTIGSLLFSNSEGGTLTLEYLLSDPNEIPLVLDADEEKPEINIADANTVLEVSAPIEGDQGFVKTGDGTLLLRRLAPHFDITEGTLVWDGAWGNVANFLADGAGMGRDAYDIFTGPTGNSWVGAEGGPNAGWLPSAYWAETTGSSLYMQAEQFVYIPTDLQVEPNTTYTVDFAVGHRSGFSPDAIEYGLWHGAPEQGDSGDPMEEIDAWIRPSLGTQGYLNYDSVPEGGWGYLSELSGSSASDQRFIFTTGADVSEYSEDLVVFIRNRSPENQTRVYFDNIRVRTHDPADVPEQPAEAIEPNLFTGTIELQGGFMQLGAHLDSWGVDTDFLISGNAGFWSDVGGSPTVSQDIVLDGAEMVVAGVTGENRTIDFSGDIAGSGGLSLDGPTTNVGLFGANSFDGPITIAPGGQTEGGSNHTRLTVGSGVDDDTSTLGDGTNPVMLEGSEEASVNEGGEETDGTATLRFARDSYTFGGDISGRGRVEIMPADFNVLLGSTISLTGNNTYEGKTFIQEGALLVEDFASLSSAANLQLNRHAVLLVGGDLAPGSSADFDWAVGTGPGEVQWTSGGGFAAFGADRVVSLGENAPIVWDQMLLNSSALFLGHPAADATLTLTNPIEVTGTGWRTFRVPAGAASVDAVAAGVISGSGVGILKQDPGTLRIEGANTYDGPTGVNGGTLILGSTASIDDSSALVVGPNGTLDVTERGSFTVADGMTLRGAGTVVGPLVVTDGFLYPGGVGLNSSPGVGTELTVDELTLSSSSLFLLDIDSRESDAARLKTNGDVNLGGAFLDMVDIAEDDEVEIAPGERIVILDYTGHELTGTFSGLPEGAEIAPFLGTGSSDPESELNRFTIHYAETTSDGWDTGNFVILRAVGEQDPYWQWAAAKGLTEENNRAFDDPDGDGIANFIEFALGGDPLQSNPGVLPIAMIADDGAETGDVIQNGGFQNPTVTAQTITATPGWASNRADSALRLHTNDEWSDIPGPAGNQVADMQVAWAVGTIRQFVNIPWSEGDEFQVNFNAVNSTTHSDASVLVRVRDQGEVLWSTSVNLDGLHPGTPPDGELIDWTEDMAHEFIVVLDDLNDGITEGSQLEFEFVAEAGRLFLDDVSVLPLSVDVDSDFLFSFLKRKDMGNVGELFIEWSADLQTWGSLPVEEGSAGGISITFEDDSEDSAMEVVLIEVPGFLIPDGRFFARLRAAQP